ncbi:MAG: XdhC family protein [Sedimentisphaerales bacterium]|nr:XdhC family protein [Sedimentisphaerales bacterium]
MDNPEIFQEAGSILETGRNVALVTVVATIGSTPGKCGYKMLVGADGRVFGTVGGGLLESEMIQEAQAQLAQPGVRLFRFDLGESSEDAKGICGGTVEFFIETFDSKALPLFGDLSIAANGADGVLVSVISSDGLPRKILFKDPGAIDAAGTDLDLEIVRAIADTAQAGRGTTRVSAGGMDVFVESVGRAPVVVLFGAGHVASHIAKFAKSVHFDVIVCDDRDEYANHERFPGADDIVVEDFGRVFDKVPIDSHCYLVIVTRGHQCDELVLEQAVKTEARYIGMIGSKRKTQTILDNLKRKGVAQELLDKVYSPIGISIGAVTAEEIALSIVGEMVKVHRLGDGAAIGHLRLSASQKRTGASHD